MHLNNPANVSEAPEIVVFAVHAGFALPAIGQAGLGQLP